MGSERWLGMCLLIAGCGGAAAEGGEVVQEPEGGGGAAAVTAPAAPREHVGIVERAAIEEDLPAWRAARESATVNAEAAGRLTSVAPGASVDVYLGTWCGDSRRELARLWAAFDAAGGTLPFTVRYVGVDRAKQAPDGLLDGVGLRYVPTIVVKRDGREVGRIVESAPEGVEVALGALLRGERTGVISGRTDL